MQSLREVANDLNLDRGDLESIEERLFALRDAARKHGIQVDDLPLLQERLAERLSMLDDQTGTIATLKKEEAQARDRYVAGAKALSAARQKAAKKLDATVNAELPPLKLDKAKFATSDRTVGRRILDRRRHGSRFVSDIDQPRRHDGTAIADRVRRRTLPASFLP